jgi:hypothetical protein
MSGSISDAISKLLDPDHGKEEPLTEDDKKLIKEYEEGTKALPAEDAHLRFSNVIRGEGSCGFAASGRKDYLLNTNTGQRYRVTVRTYWSQGIESGQYDRVHISEAGGKKHLGCTKSGSIPVASYRRVVVGESPI